MSLSLKVQSVNEKCENCASGLWQFLALLKFTLHPFHPVFKSVQIGKATSCLTFAHTSLRETVSRLDIQPDFVLPNSVDVDFLEVKCHLAV